jgi:hypothetical protein
LRLVINLKSLNKLLRKYVYPFKMETTRSIMAALHQGDWTVSVDRRDAYFHIPIHKASQEFLRFTHGGRVFQFIALPFELAPAHGDGGQSGTQTYDAPVLVSRRFTDAECMHTGVAASSSSSFSASSIRWFFLRNDEK